MEYNGESISENEWNASERENIYKDIDDEWYYNIQDEKIPTFNIFFNGNLEITVISSEDDVKEAVYNLNNNLMDRNDIESFIFKIYKNESEKISNNSHFC